MIFKSYGSDGSPSTAVPASEQSGAAVVVVLVVDVDVVVDVVVGVVVHPVQSALVLQTVTSVQGSIVNPVPLG
jgi:hypothetical protein